ncbi:major facilitator superfamily domain-containing protein [Lactarius akahatsu]|uniref:Major facilitator superfamily domain-containing protein n=1 Tax=Lactarius akahatsu TaxID=416441 RepID=A0AAD4LRI7_9AGAM|nr:major facilitator superfamily domain-containing protein [Lactarius akahatsu]
MSLSTLGILLYSYKLSSIFAGGIFIFPLLSPVLALHLKFTQPQLTTIVLLGMMGQYPFSAPIGKIVDEYGPWACSLIASFLYSGSFAILAAEIAKTPDNITGPSESSFRILAGAFFVMGLATDASYVSSYYFSTLFAATRTFPQYLGAASGASMTLFGLSPLFLSLLASTFFTDPPTGLDVPRFLKFLALASGIVHLIGAFNMRLCKPQCITPSTPASAPTSDEERSIDEREPLLPNKPHRSESQIIPIGESRPVIELFKDSHFWLLALVALIILGSCEMIMSNIGTIILSLYSERTVSIGGSSSAAAATATQVRLISISNTLSRVVVGPLADLISPVTSRASGDSPSSPQRYRVSRVALLSFVPVLLVGTFLYLELAIRTPGDLWILSVNTGAAYGITFTIIPSIVSTIWGNRDFGRNFGIMTYAPFFGTPLFSYLYAFVSDHNNVGAGVCTGIACWSSTFWVITGTTLLSCVASTLLWRRWAGLV